MKIEHSKLKKLLNKKTILITGGTGSFGKACTKILLKYFNLKKIIIYSRDEMKQYEMAQKFPQKNIRYFILYLNCYRMQMIPRQTKPAFYLKKTK